MAVQDKAYDILASNSWFVHINEIEGNFVEFEITFEKLQLNKVLKKSAIESNNTSRFRAKAEGFIEEIIRQDSQKFDLEDLINEDLHLVINTFSEVFLSAVEEAYREKLLELEEE